ncbi:unnamed protein product [Auanema sp. JU1783]|nr:unnamed protein product [Auanema sp. JU1783]
MSHVQRNNDSLCFPDMGDWPSNGGSLKVHRPHLCDQSRIIICRVLAYNREMAKRLGPNSGNTPFAQPDVLTAAMTGFKPNVVRQCEDKKLELLKCTDKGPFTTLATQRIREEARERLAVVFATSDDEEPTQRIPQAKK